MRRRAAVLWVVLVLLTTSALVLAANRTGLMGKGGCCAVRQAPE